MITPQSCPPAVGAGASDGRSHIFGFLRFDQRVLHFAADESRSRQQLAELMAFGGR